MSTNKFAFDQDGLEQLVGRVRQVLARKEGAEVGRIKDRAVVHALGATPSALPTWRKRGTIPFSNLVMFAFEYDVSLDWLFYGGPHDMWLDKEGGIEIDRERRDVTLELIEDCAAALRIIERDHGLKLSDDKFGKIVAMLFEEYYDAAVSEHQQDKEPVPVIDTAKVIQLARLAS